jgi:hypothetical protein
MPCSAARALKLAYGTAGKAGPGRGAMPVTCAIAPIFAMTTPS